MRSGPAQMHSLPMFHLPREACQCGVKYRQPVQAFLQLLAVPIMKFPNHSEPWVPCPLHREV